jgi:Rieske Fe-S protein
MNRKQFLITLTLPVVAACKHKRQEVIIQRQVLLEADLRTELLNVGSYKANTAFGLFVRRIAPGNTSQAFQCFWTICTHARCFVNYDNNQDRFLCPCHGSMFDGSGQVLQGPAAMELERKEVEVNGVMLKVYA